MRTNPLGDVAEQVRADRKAAHAASDQFHRHSRKAGSLPGQEIATESRQNQEQDQHGPQFLATGKRQAVHCQERLLGVANTKALRR